MRHSTATLRKEVKQKSRKVEKEFVLIKSGQERVSDTRIFKDHKTRFGDHLSTARITRLEV